MSEIKIGSLIQRISLFDDQQAFKKLFWHYYDNLFNFSCSFVGSKEAAEEIVEDVFVSVWKNRATLLEITNLKVYLYSAVKNRSYNYLNRSKHRYIQDITALERTIASSLPTPEESLFTTELRQVFDNAIANLPPKCRQVYTLVKVDGLHYKEVATILEISPKTVENHIAKALRKIEENVNLKLKGPITNEFKSSR